ncbi:MAG: CpaD family pilus assembly protein [Novosphingobium sp.]|jgi:pilus assembly protein CpaD|nr:CpaD family pilus assembly protein [Brevundimonas sp.]MCZ8322433.1 CpaD family pilus assembly protein [Novosphingobium sp.]
MRSFKTRKALAAAFSLSMGLALAGCGGMASNPSLESVHQPVVSRTNYTLDVASGPGGLSMPEARRLAGWFEAMDLRYGDRVAIDDPLNSSITLTSVEAVAGRFGMLVSGDAPVTPGAVNPGTVRIVVTRSSATVPGCPDWSAKSDATFKNGTSSNYGCASNANLAAMVADPEHLLKGANSTGRTVLMSGNKAIESYRDAKPTGQGGLKDNSTQGGK